MKARITTVQWRIMARLLPLLVLLFVVTLAWLGTHLTRLLYANALEVAKRSNLAVVNAVQASMTSDAGHRGWTRVPDEIARDPMTQIDVVNTRGKVVYSSRRSRIGNRIERSSWMCAQCHAGGSARATTDAKFITGPSEAEFQVFAAPLRNAELCRKCHTQEGSKIGVVLVRQSIEPVRAQVRTVQVALATAGITALLLTLLVARVLLGRFVARPLKRLVAGARAIGAGELEQHLDLGEKTELSVLADALNSAARRLRVMIGQLGRQRDDFESLYRLVDQLGRSITPEERRQRCVQLASEILGSDCLLVRAVSGGGTQAEGLVITYRDSDGTIIDRDVSIDLDKEPLPFRGSTSVVARWLRGEVEDVEAVRTYEVTAYPLRRHGQSLGLLVRDAFPGSETIRGLSPGIEPDMVRALCKHLAIALEFSALQRDLIGRERLAAIGETVAGLAHCLKNTLNGLRAGQYVVDRANETGDEARLRDGWRVMKNSARQVERLTLDMLYYVKERPPRREPIDPNLILQEVVDVLEEMARAKKVDLQTDLDPRIGQVPLDRTAIYRAIMDLASNAVDACTESEHGDTVILRSRRTGSDVVLSVEDNGVGIPEEIRSILFTRFFSTKAGKGTGLGLSVVKKIVEEHGGRVEVFSQLGRGATFLCHLPVYPYPQQPTPPRPMTSRPPYP